MQEEELTLSLKATLEGSSDILDPDLDSRLRRPVESFSFSDSKYRRLLTHSEMSILSDNTMLLLLGSEQFFRSDQLLGSDRLFGSDTSFVSDMCFSNFVQLSCDWNRELVVSFAGGMLLFSETKPCPQDGRRLPSDLLCSTTSTKAVSHFGRRALEFSGSDSS